MNASESIDRLLDLIDALDKQIDALTEARDLIVRSLENRHPIEAEDPDECCCYVPTPKALALISGQKIAGA